MSRSIKPDEYLLERIRWLINLRWIAAAGVVVTVYVVFQALHIPLRVVPLCVTTVILIAYNALLSFVVRHKQRPSWKATSRVNWLANIQISLDLTCLSVLIHFSGGIENPFIFYFIFHTIIASILLTRRAAFLQAAYAIFLFLTIAFSEYFSLLAHYCLEGVLPYSLHDQIAYVLGVSFVFITTLSIAAYMATSISAQLKERERSLKEANKLLDEKDRIKSEYVLRVTHDIKEDLSAIQQCIEPVAIGITGPLIPAQANLLNRAKERSEKLSLYVNALLGITKMKLTKKLEMESFSFSELIREISEHIKARAQSKQIAFEVDVDPRIAFIKGMRVYVQEALLNLLANSLKYTPAGGKLRLEAKEEDRSVLITIRDTGIGIPKDELPHIFEEFFRASNARRQERLGTGLGLAIAKQITKMHKGQIWVESEVGKGTTFYLKLPHPS